MEPSQKLLEFVRRMEGAFGKQSIIELKDISNDAIQLAALKSSHLLSEVSLIAYSLHKLLTKVHIAESGEWDALRDEIEKDLDSALEMIGKNDLKGFEKALHGVIGGIAAVDSELGNYVQGTYDKARIKQASRAYSFGISLSRAAELTGADKKELLQYIGATKMHDEEAIKFGIGERLKELKKALGK